MGNYQRAYTILEVLLVILLIAVWVGVTLPRFGGGGILNKYRLRTTVYNITSYMRSARNSAITNARNYIVKFDFAKAPQEYRIYKWSIAPSNQVGDTETIPSSIRGSGTDQWTFSSLGDASWSTGTGAITFTIASQGRWTIAVIGPTGTVRIQKP